MYFILIAFFDALCYSLYNRNVHYKVKEVYIMLLKEEIKEILKEMTECMNKDYTKDNEEVFEDIIIDVEKDEVIEAIRYISQLRKISILKKLPLEEWRKNELIDLINHYEIYTDDIIEHANDIYEVRNYLYDVDNFIKLGKYEEYYTPSLEEMKRDS